MITHSERVLFDLKARVEAQETIVPKAEGRGHYCSVGGHKGI